MRMPPWPADATMARWLRALPRLAAVLVVTVGAMALAGWALPLSAAVAFIALLGYVYQVRYLYQVATGTGMALQTAATFLMLNGGLLACRPDRQPTRTFIASSPGGLLARRLVPALVLVPLGVGAAVALGQAGRLFEPALGTALTTLAILAAL